MKEERLATDAGQWLEAFEAALAASDEAALQDLFHPVSHWRDVLALTWNIQTLSGAAPIIEALKVRACEVKPHGFAVDARRTAPREVTRAGARTYETLFRFETEQGRCSGVLRLVPSAGGKLKAWTLMTALDELKGHEESVGKA